jgi:hypothetical protein
VVKEKKKYWIILGILVFIIYVFAAAQPIPEETILVPRWISSLESNYSAYIAAENTVVQNYLVPFRLGNRFGYVDTQGQFIVNQPIKGGVSLSENRWAEFDSIPTGITIRNPAGESLTVIEKGRGYPLFMDNKIFLIGEDQNSLSLTDDRGDILWTYDFAAPLTSIDAAADLILTGSLDGTVELLDAGGKRVFFFEPGGSRLSVILGCRISKNGSRLAIISGFDDQRFLMLERFGDSYKVIYHEFLKDGFRHAVHMAFVDNDRWIVYEREGGLGIYKIDTRQSIQVPLPGDIIAMDETGNKELLFVITSLGGRLKNLAAIHLSGTMVTSAPFNSETAFLSRRGSELYVGGGMILASFELDKR